MLSTEMEGITMSEDDMDLLDDDNVSKAFLLNKIKSLSAKINVFARQNQLLLLEIQSVRANGCSCSSRNTDEVAPPRKIPKVSNKNSNSPSASKSIINDKSKEASSTKVNAVNIDKNTAIKQKRKIFQVVDTNALGVRKSLLEAGCADFNIKQTGVKAPVKISVGVDEVSKVRHTLKQANSSFHEFKLADERFCCFLIKGLVGVEENDLPVIKQQLIEQDLPENITLTFL